MFCEDALQLGNTGKRERMIAVQCTAGIHSTHQYDTRDGIIVLELTGDLR